jgi:hypothetical protein
LPPGYQKITCLMIFSVKMGENFRRKAHFVAYGHKTKTPAAMTYSLVMSRDSVCIALMIAALNDLNIMACDIQNAYLTPADCREKYWTAARPEFGSKAGLLMIIKKALYGLPVPHSERILLRRWMQWATSPATQTQTFGCQQR